MKTNAGERCPTCGQPVPSIRNSAWLIEILTHGEPHREVYRAQDGSWYVTYGGGSVSADVVRELVQQGVIASVYSDCPTDAYHVGRTYDTERTLEARKKLGKQAPNYYVGDPT